MKKITLKTLLALACMMCSLGTMAHDFVVDGIYYLILNEDDLTVAVTFRGNAFDSYDNEYSGKVVIPNKSKRLRPGMYVTTTLGVGKEKAIVVPYQSVEKLIGSNERFVFINNNGYAKRVSVKLGQRFDEMIEIIAPEIQDGVEYIHVGQHKLVDGVKINVK